MASITTAVAIDFLDALDDAANAGAGAAVLRVYDGTAPANADAAIGSAGTNNLLAELTMSAVAFAAASGSAGSNATMAAASITDDTTADASGTPTFCRIVADGGSGATVCQLTAGVSSGEVQFASAISSGATVSISALTITQPIV